MKKQPDAWEIEEDDYGDEIWYGGKGCGLITVNGWTNGGCKDDPEKWEALKAEARLISAAPDLLNALENLTKFIEQAYPNATEWVRYTRAKAAIAKATGETK